MKYSLISKYHPDSQALMSYAEGLVDTQASLNPEVAAHLNTCAHCQEQVHEIRDSLRIINEIEDVEALSDLTASILLAAKQEPRPVRSMNPWLRNTAVAASLLLMATFGLGRVAEQQSASTPINETASQETYPSATEEAVQDIISRHAPIPQSTPAEDLIDPALLESRRNPSTKQEHAQYKAVYTYNDYIAEAEYALTMNPGLSRAYDTILTTQDLRDDTLVAIYMNDQ